MKNPDVLMKDETIHLKTKLLFIDHSTVSGKNEVMLKVTRPAWAGFKTAEEGRTKIM